MTGSILRRTVFRSIITWGVFGVAASGMAGIFLYSLIMEKNIMFGLLIGVYFVVQLISALWNLRVCQKILFGPKKIVPHKEWFEKNHYETYASEYFLANPRRVGILVVGYREDPQFWRHCVESIRKHSPPHLVQVVCASIDGNEDVDRRMVDEFDTVWQSTSIAGDSGFSDIPLEPLIETVRLLLPHRGKRHTMRSGFEYLRKYYPSLDYIIVMDSDSIITPNSVWSLVRLMDENPANGCATGSLEIFNNDNYLSRIVNARYLYAFNVERSAMSAHGCMNCCSGPFSIYRVSCLDDRLLSDFVGQRFCMQPVGPGDDRHLTNLILAKGYKSIQSPYSIAYTECPLQIQRFFIQQLRWMRSFYREQSYQMYALPVQSWYLVMVTIYEIFFPFFILLSMLPTLGIVHPSPLEVFRNRVFLCMGIIFLRTIILMIVTHRIDVWYNVFMLPLYFTSLLPMKFYALLTVGIQNWLTSNRRFLKKLCNVDVFTMYLVILLWNILYIFLIIHRIGYLTFIF